MATQLQLAPSRLDFSQDVFEILNQTGRGEFERVPVTERMAGCMVTKVQSNKADFLQSLH